MNKNLKNNFSKNFDDLPFELQKNIFLDNASYYQQQLINDSILYQQIYIKYTEKLDKLKSHQLPDSLMQYYINIYENKNIYLSVVRKKAYERLTKFYIPLIKMLKEEIKEFKNKLNALNNSIKNNRKMYYYFYHKYKST